MRLRRTALAGTDEDARRSTSGYSDGESALGNPKWKGPHRCGPSHCWELILPSATSATAARAATTMTSRTTSWTAARTAATAAPAIAIAIATTAAGTSLTRAFGPRRARFYRRNHSLHTVEVRLSVRIEIRAAFDHRRGRAWL